MQIEKLIDWGGYDEPDADLAIMAINEIVEKINEIIEVVNKGEK